MSYTGNDISIYYLFNTEEPYDLELLAEEAGSRDADDLRDSLDAALDDDADFREYAENELGEYGGIGIDWYYANDGKSLAIVIKCYDRRIFSWKWEKYDELAGEMEALLDRVFFSVLGRERGVSYIDYSVEDMSGCHPN